MLTTSVSLSGPPEPVLPRSFEVIVKLAAPLKPAVGVKIMPFRAVLTFASVPRKVIVASAVPSPAPVPLPSLKLKLKPVMPLSVSVPLVAVSVTWMLFVPASGSATEIWLPLAPENTSGVFCAVPCAPGTVLTGGSLTDVTLMVLVAAVLGKAPSLTIHETVRVNVDGFSDVLLYLTERKAAW